MTHPRPVLQARRMPERISFFITMQSLRVPQARRAGVAQLVEQLTCNEKVEGSIPFTGTNSTQ